MTPITIDVPLDIADVEWVASVKITNYVRGAAPSYGGSLDYCDPGWPDEIEWHIEEVRQDSKNAKWGRGVANALTQLLYDSEVIREACLDAIADARQPQEV